MFSVESSALTQLLTVNFFEHVSRAEMSACRLEVEEHLHGMKTGFRMLTDLTCLVLMEAACAAPLGDIMDLCSGSGVSAIHRVSPEPEKDIGFALMSPFHYAREVRMVTHDDTAEALDSLGPSA